MTIQQLEYILAVDQFRHFARAAEYCRVTQPTLSAMIQKLEDEPQMLLAERGQLVLGHFADLVFAYVDLAGCRLFQPGQLVQQRGFAAAGLADDTAELAFFY